MRTIAIILLAFTLTSMAAHAADCGPLQLVNQVAIAPLDNGLIGIPVTLNGENTVFLLSTGGMTTQITRAYAEAHNLPIRPNSKNLANLALHFSNEEASVHQMVLGQMKTGETFFPITPDPTAQSGLISLNYLMAFDMDLDFDARTLKFFSPEHCPGKVNYWAPTVTEIPIKVRDGHIIAAVTISGKNFDAIIDTGIADTLMSTGIAKNFLGLKLGAPDTPAKGTADTPEFARMYTTTFFKGLDNPQPPQMYEHSFPDFALGGISINGSSVKIVPISGVKGTGVIIGMDMLRKLHIYFSFKEDKMYVSQTPPSVGSNTAPPVTALQPAAPSR